MPGVLELPQLAEHDRMAQVDVGCGRVDAELHAQRPRLLGGLRELLRQRPRGQRIDRVRGEPGGML